jgi:hypothetical protein
MLKSPFIRAKAEDAFDGGYISAMSGRQYCRRPQILGVI